MLTISTRSLLAAGLVTMAGAGMACALGAIWLLRHLEDRDRRHVLWGYPYTTQGL